LEASQLNNIDMIISDIGLPDGSGLQLMREVVARRGPVPSIALTGYGMEEDIRRSREAGFTAHMTKPIDFAKLDGTIRHVALGVGSKSLMTPLPTETVPDPQSDSSSPK
jgi:CheY-like chemotaxis protein